MALLGRRAFLASALAVLATAARGDDDDDKDKECESGQDCALKAREQGKIRPLSEVLAAARAVVPGEVVKIELEREDGVWVYELKILTPSGRRRKVEINAETLAIIKVD